VGASVDVGADVAVDAGRAVDACRACDACRVRIGAPACQCGPVNIGDRLELEVTAVVAGGDGLARAGDGRVVLVSGALPGENVVVELSEVRRDMARGAVVELRRTAPTRVKPTCPHVGDGCGGCGLQHVAVDAELSLLVEIVTDALRRLARLPDADVVSVTPGPGGADLRRTTVRLAVDGDGALAHRRAGSRQTVALDSCEVTHPRLVELLTSRWVDADEVQLRVSVHSGERTAWPIRLAPRAGSRAGSRHHRGASSRASAATASVQGLAADVAIGDRTQIVERIGDVELVVSAQSFFQASPGAGELLVKRVAAGSEPMLSQARVVVDAYGGVGLFAATLAPRAPDAHWVVLESNRSAVADARRNLDGRDAAIVAGEVARWVPTTADLVIADPSRTGLGAAATASLAASGASRLVLVSCDAASLGRDSALLAAHGFRHVRSEVLSLFPRTPHVEVVTVFDR
jgi:23S rRNA (uracil1939-C5)-methyltransferase